LNDEAAETLSDDNRKKSTVSTDLEQFLRNGLVKVDCAEEVSGIVLKLMRLYLSQDTSLDAELQKIFQDAYQGLFQLDENDKCVLLTIIRLMMFNNLIFLPSSQNIPPVDGGIKLLLSNHTKQSAR
jgi:hypothetical protein